MPAPPDRPNEPIYRRLGVPTIINASDPSTRLSVGIMHPEVSQAMEVAPQWGRACELIAEGHRCRSRIRDGRHRGRLIPGKPGNQPGQS